MTHNNYINLVNTIKSHDYRYWTLNAPIIPDEQYDALYSALQETEQLHPDWILPDSPTQVISTAVNGNGRHLVRRRTIMLSTEKANSVDKLLTWMQKTTKQAAELGCSNPNLFTIEWKYDGESCSLVYLDGDLVEASTGKGMDGMDAIQHVCYIPNIPQHIDTKGRVEVRGEITCQPLGLLHINEYLKSQGLKTYANPRSAAAGYLACAIADQNVGRYLEVTLFYVDADGYNDKSLADALTTIRVASSSYPVECTMENIESIIAERAKKRDGLPFPTDGLVIKAYDRSRWSDFGATDHHPKYLCAYKFPAKAENGTVLYSNLKDIEFSVADTGRITPVAIFDPVMLYGTKVHRIGLASHNKFSESMPWHIGDTLTVTKGNEITPKILGHDHNGTGKEIPFPTHCPICGAPVTIDGAYAYCLNESCPKKQPTATNNGARHSVKMAQPSLLSDTTTGSELAGMSIVVSGNFGDPATKANIKTMVTRHGGHLQDSVNGKTTHLICGATGVGPAKIAKAEKLCVQIIDQAQFLSLINHK